MPYSKRRFVIVGGGPAGLTAAYELTKHGQRPVVVEKAHIVGGLARTENYKGYHFDMGGHRFFTKSKQVERMWHEVLTDDFLLRPRMSRIFYKKRFFDYPLKPLNALLGLGIVESVLILLSYCRWRVFPYREETSFEQWVTNRFGRRLFKIFFESYTEKVWGIPCTELSAEWAAQRIKNLSLKSAILSMIVKPKTKITTLIEQFHYPRLGPGMLWNSVKAKIEQRGGEVRMESDVVAVRRTGNRIDEVDICRNGAVETIDGTDFISSMPLTEFVKKLDPPAPTAVLEAAGKLSYRDFLTVCLIVNKPGLFPDNWIYIHDPDVKVGRIQNFRNWSPEMVPPGGADSLGMEYFCNEGDDLWNSSDADLIALGKRELEQIGLARAEEVVDGCVFRVPKSYPVYDSEYRGYLATIRQYVDGLENFQTIGRNGLHRYNNQDHAMLTGMLAVRNSLLGEANDLWSVNTEQEYHEELREEVRHEVAVSEHLSEEAAEVVIEEVLAATFSKLDRMAFGLALGAVSSGVLFLATLLLLLKGGDVVGPNLQLLDNFFPGYSVTWLGSAVGLLYGFAAGFGLGWTFALVRNSAVFLYLAVARRRAERSILRKLLEYI